MSAARRAAGGKNKSTAQLRTEALTALVGGLVNIALGGLFLMIVAPLAHDVLGTPDRHPGYWPSLTLFLAVAILAEKLRTFITGAK